MKSVTMVDSFFLRVISAAGILPMPISLKWWKSLKHTANINPGGAPLKLKGIK
jgi:hypothetical protein